MNTKLLKMGLDKILEINLDDVDLVRLQPELAAQSARNALKHVVHRRRPAHKHVLEICLRWQALHQRNHVVCRCKLFVAVAGVLRHEHESVMKSEVSEQLCNFFGKLDSDGVVSVRIVRVHDELGVAHVVFERLTFEHLALLAVLADQAARKIRKQVDERQYACASDDDQVRADDVAFVEVEAFAVDA